MLISEFAKKERNGNGINPVGKLNFKEEVKEDERHIPLSSNVEISKDSNPL